MCKICSNLTMTTPEWRPMTSLLLTLNRFHTLFCCLHCSLWTSKCQLGIDFTSFKVKAIGVITIMLLIHFRFHTIKCYSGSWSARMHYFQRKIILNEILYFINNTKKTRLTYFRAFPFYFTWKHQKTRGYRKGTLDWNGLSLFIPPPSGSNFLCHFAIPKSILSQVF